MGEVGNNPEVLRKSQLVSLKDKRVGNENNVRIGELYDEPGMVFDCLPLLEHGQMGSGSFSEVYFRVNGGNIYLLDDSGNLIDADLTARTKEAQGIRFSKDQLEGVKLVVGEPFLGGRTGAITEIVATNENFHPISNYPSIRQSSILEDFQVKVPPKELGDWARDQVTGKKNLKTNLPDKLKSI